MYRQLRSEYSGRIATITLDRPARRNALSAELMRELIDAYAGMGAHAVSYMAHDQFELAAASPESRTAREAALKRKKP